MADQERRQKPRVQLGTEAFIEDGGQKTPGYALDLAAQGIGVICDLERAIGQPIKVHFLLPGDAGWLAADAVLVRIGKRRGDKVMGLRFQRLDNRTQSLVERYVRDQLVLRARERIRGQAGRERGRDKKENPVKRLLRAALAPLTGKKQG
jgi:c-di-GMP-binding flagellar brake protein YcgR